MADPKDPVSGKDLLSQILKQLEADGARNKRHDDKVAKEEKESKSWRGRLTKALTGRGITSMFGLGIAGLAREAENMRKAAFIVQRDYRDVMAENRDVLEGIPGGMIFATRELIDAQRAGFQGVGKSYINLSKENRLLTGSNAMLISTMTSVAATLGQNNNLIEVLSKNTSENAVAYRRSTVDLLEGMKKIMSTMGTRLAAIGAPMMTKRIADIMDRLPKNLQDPLMTVIETLTAGQREIGAFARVGVMDLVDGLHTTDNLLGDLRAVVDAFGSNIQSIQSQYGRSTLQYSIAAEPLAGLTQDQIVAFLRVQEGLNKMGPAVEKNGLKLTKHGETMTAAMESVREPALNVAVAMQDILAPALNRVGSIIGHILIPVLVANTAAASIKGIGGMFGFTGKSAGIIGTLMRFAGPIGLGIGVLGSFLPLIFDAGNKRGRQADDAASKHTDLLAGIETNTRDPEITPTPGFTGFAETTSRLISASMREAMFAGTDLEDASKMTQEQVALLREVVKTLKESVPDPFSGGAPGP